MLIPSNQGDPSVHGFLRRVSSHLARVGQGLPRNLFNREQDALKAGEQITTFVLPEKSTAQSYINCFFEHANVTYRYVPRTDIIELFDLVYADGDSMPEDPTKMAMLLLVMGLGYDYFLIPSALLCQINGTMSTDVSLIVVYGWRHGRMSHSHLGGPKRIVLPDTFMEMRNGTFLTI